MLLSKVCLILISLFSNGLAITVENAPQTYLDSLVKGSTCGSVYSNGNDASIMVELDDLYLESRVPNLDTLSLPIAIFRYPHIKYYDGFPSFDEFNKMYTNPTKFRQNTYNKIRNLNTSEITNSYLIKTLGNPTMYVDNFIENGRVIKRIIKMEVEQSGLYCVYMVPPQEYALKGLVTATVTYKNSYGYIKDLEFDQYRALILSAIVGTIILIGLLYYYNYKLPHNVLFIDIYTGIIYHGLIPILLINCLLIIPFVLKNNISPVRLSNAIFFTTSVSLLSFSGEY